MGPRLRVTPEEFFQIVTREKGLVIKGPKVWISGITYLTCSGDYYYYTVVKEPIHLPPDTPVSEVTSILL